MAAEGLTNAVVSESLGISRYALTSRLAGRVGFSLTDLDRFAKLTGYKADEFMATTFCLLPVGKVA